MSPAFSVLLITERPEQLTGGGCCGRLEGDLTILGCREELFELARERQKSLARVEQYLTKLVEETGLEIDVVWIDPRNQLYLATRLLKDVLRYRPGLAAGLRALTQWFRLPAIIINGTVVAQGAAADDERLQAVRAFFEHRASAA